MSSKNIQTICCFFLIILGAAYSEEDCPSAKELENNNHFPKTKQINATTLEVDWSHIWPKLNWKKCALSLEIFVNNLPVQTVDDVELKVSTISVEPCQDLEVVIEIDLNSPREVEYEDGSTTRVKSYPNKEAKTFRPPKAKEDVAQKVQVSYLKGDPTSVEIKLKFTDLVDDPACHKVGNVSLVLREKNDVSTQPDLFVKTVGIFRHLEEVISKKLVDFCVEYEVLARLIGPDGTHSTEISLSTVGPISDADLESAFLSGFRHEIKVSPTDLRVQSSGTDNLLIRWSRLASTVCVKGYFIKVEEFEHYVDANVDKFYLTNLHPCRQYLITMQAYIGRFQKSEKPIYVSKFSDPLIAYTSPDSTSIPFDLSTLKIRRGKTSITAFWLRREWPCLFPMSTEDDVEFVEPKVRVDICREKNGSTCFKPQGKIRNVDERLAVTFQGLLPCTDYHVRFLPLVTTEVEENHGTGTRSRHADVEEGPMGSDDPDYIIVDSENEVEYPEEPEPENSWAPIWKEVRTAMVIEAPKEIETRNVTETSISLAWRRSTCASAYLIYYTPLNNTKIHGGSKWVNLRNGNIEHNESVDINEVEIDKNDVDEERSRRRRHRRSADANDSTDYEFDKIIGLLGPEDKNKPSVSVQEPEVDEGDADDDDDDEDTNEGSGSGEIDTAKEIKVQTTTESVKDDKLRPEVRFDGPEYENFIDADEDEEEEDEPEPRLEETIEHEVDSSISEPEDEEFIKDESPTGHLDQVKRNEVEIGKNENDSGDSKEEGLESSGLEPRSGDLDVGGDDLHSESTVYDSGSSTPKIETSLQKDERTPEYDQEEIDNEVEAQNKFEEDGELEREHFMEYDVIGTGDSQSVNPDLDDESGSAEIQIDPIPNDVITAPTSGPREDFLFEGSGDFTDFGSGDDEESGSGLLSDDEEDFFAQYPDLVVLDQARPQFINVRIKGLTPCQDYGFKVQGFFKMDGLEKFSSPSTIELQTKCPENDTVIETTTTTTTTSTTTTTTTTTTEAPEPEFHIYNISVEQKAHSETVQLALLWSQEKLVSVTIRWDDKSNFTAEKNLPISTEAEDKLHFISLPFCHTFEISFFTTFHRSNQHKLAWNQNVTTLPDPRREFELEDFRIGVTRNSPTGSADATWTHSFPCVTRYAIRLVRSDVSDADNALREAENGARGEMFINAPSKVGEEVGLDLHMVPGILNLQNCRTYQLFIFPDNFPGQKSELGKWDEGMEMTFDYVTPDGDVPNEIDLDDQVSVVSQSDRAEIVWGGEAFSCSEVEMIVSSLRFLYRKHSHLEQVIFRQTLVPLSESESTVVYKLSPCIPYNLEVRDSAKNTTLLTKEFRTSPGDGEPLALEEGEVLVWRTRDVDEIKIEWADRCSEEGYHLDICRLPGNVDCRKFDVPAPETSDSYPIQVITDLLGCTAYSYNISTNVGHLLYNGFHRTQVVASTDFKLIPQEIDIRQNATSISVDWRHTSDCVVSYVVTAELEKVEKIGISSPNLINKESDSKIKLEFDDVGNNLLKQCRNYKLTILPILNSTEVDDEVTVIPYETTFFFFNEPTSPEDVVVVKKTTNEVELEWNHFHKCYVGYHVTATRVKDDKVISSAETRPDVNVKKVNSDLNNLTPCTEYRVDIESISVIDNQRISSSPTTLHFVTEHSNRIDVIPFPEHEEIAFAVLLDGVDCLSEYVLTLCDFGDDRKCQNRTVVETGNVTFGGLVHDTSYSYQLIGLDQSMKEVFYSPEFQLDTRPRVSGRFEVKGVEENKIELEVVLSEFDVKKKKYDVDVSVECANGHDEVFSKETDSFQNLTFVFDELDPNTIYNCRGVLIFDGVESIIQKVEVETLDGIPDKPENLKAIKQEPERVEISWDTPKISRGIVQEYQIDVFPMFDKTKKDDIFCGTEVRHEKEFRLVSSGGGNVTEALLEGLTPATSYDVTIRAQTRHMKPGHPSDTLTVSTPSGRPHKPVIKKSYQSRGGELIIDFSYPCPMTGQTTFRASWACAAASTEGLTCNEKANVSQTFLTPKTIKLSGLPGGHFYDLRVIASVAECHGGDCEVESDVHVGFITCDYRCKDGTCLYNPNARCNYVLECPDGSDEWDCPCDPPHHFRCANKFCIQASRRCDGNTDCNDYSDETGCPSCKHETQFRCRTTNQCIPKNRTCDRKVDCRDGSDEDGCAYWKSSCWPDQFRCLDGTCVSMIHRCDGVWDCQGGEDEMSCDNFCRGGRFTCKNRKNCIEHHQYCDGKNDCPDGSDELTDCVCNRAGQFACKTPAGNPQCVSRMAVCDGRDDCDDGSDEAPCRKPMESSLVMKLMSDEPNLNAFYVTMSVAETTTHSVPKSTGGDLYVTISDATEKQSKSTPKNRNRRTRKKPVDPNNQPSLKEVPDRHRHRKNRIDSEEQNGRKDSDPLQQSKRSTPSPKVDVHVYPVVQTVFSGHDVVLQCRDEGDERAEVFWSRDDGVPLPERAIQIRGRLDISGIRIEEGGVYVCKVHGLSHVQGGRMSANVKVVARP